MFALFYLVVFCCDVIYFRCAKLCRLRGEICCSSLCDGRDIDSDSDSYSDTGEFDEEAPVAEDVALVAVRRRKNDMGRILHRYYLCIWHPISDLLADVISIVGVINLEVSSC